MNVRASLALLITLVVCGAARAEWPHAGAVVEVCKPEAEVVVVVQQGRELFSHAPSARLLAAVERSGLFDRSGEAWRAFTRRIGVEPGEGARALLGGRFVLAVGADAAGGEQGRAWLVATEVEPGFAERVRRGASAMPRRRLDGRPVYTIEDGALQLMVIKPPEGTAQSLLVIGPADGQASGDGWFDRVSVSLVNRWTGAGQGVAERDAGLIYLRGEHGRAGEWEAEARVERTHRGFAATVSAETARRLGAERSLPGVDGVIPTGEVLLVTRGPIDLLPGGLGGVAADIIDPASEVVVVFDGPADAAEDAAQRGAWGGAWGGLTIMAGLRPGLEDPVARADAAIAGFFGAFSQSRVSDHAGRFPGSVRVQRLGGAWGSDDTPDPGEVTLAWRVERGIGGAQGGGVLVFGVGGDKAGVVRRVERVDVAGGGLLGRPPVFEGEADLARLAGLMWSEPERSAGLPGVFAVIERASWRLAEDQGGGLTGRVRVDIVPAPSAEIGGGSGAGR